MDGLLTSLALTGGCRADEAFQYGREEWGSKGEVGLGRKGLRSIDGAVCPKPKLSLALSFRLALWREDQ